MPGPLRVWIRLGLVLGLAGLAAALPAAPAAGAAATVKYYQVRASADGSAETLAAIADRLLGSPDRAGEIVTLNRGRRQPDGGRLTTPAVLRTGWFLVLPWDAVGPGVELGPLPSGPTTGPPPTGPVVPPSTGPVVASPTGPVVGSGGPGGAPATDPVEAPSTCSGMPAGASADIPWPQLRLAPDQAWPTATGAGVTVAVIDSGVDSAVPALAGRIDPAVTIGGDHRRPAGCADHGTVMAGIIAAGPVAGHGLVGIAPHTRILPIEVDPAAGVVPPDQLVDALAAAVRARVGVAMIALPARIDDPSVAAAIGDALAHNVIVVVRAGALSRTGRAGVLRVGAVTADDDLARQYPADTVDVLAPGDAVVSLAGGGAGQVRGSGTDYAVAFVAGLAALVRSASPTLSAPQATHTIESTADHGPDVTSADPVHGWGVIDPVAAVLALPATSPRPATAAPGGGPDAALLVGAALIVLLAVWAWRSWRRRPADVGAGVA